MYSIFVCLLVSHKICVCYSVLFFFVFFFTEEDEGHYGANPHPYLFNL